MGYTTTFVGSVSLSRKLTFAEARFILNLDREQTGIDAYFQWVPDTTLSNIVWDGQEKFHDYTDQLRWLCRWLGNSGIVAHGTIYWQGEETGDTGVLNVIGNQVFERSDQIPEQKHLKPLTERALQEMALEVLTSLATEEYSASSTKKK